MNTTRFYLFLSLTAILMAARAQTDILELWSKVPNRTETNAKEIKEQTGLFQSRSGRYLKTLQLRFTYRPKQMPKDKRS